MVADVLFAQRRDFFDIVEVVAVAGTQPVLGKKAAIVGNLGFDVGQERLQAFKLVFLVAFEGPVFGFSVENPTSYERTANKDNALESRDRSAVRGCGAKAFPARAFDRWCV